MARALDRLRQLALLLGGNRSDAAGDDLAALGHKALEQTDVLIVDLRRVLAGKGAGLTATEKWACHVLMTFLRCHVVARSEGRRVGKEGCDTVSSRWSPSK